MRSMLFWGSWRLAFSTPKWSLWWNAPLPIGPPGTISSRTWWRSGASWWWYRHQFLRIFPHETTHDDLMTIDVVWCCMMLSQNVTAQSAKLFQWINGQHSKIEAFVTLCPKERRTSHGGNQMSFPLCRPLAFVSLATFVICDSVTCQKHRDLTQCCRVLHGLGASQVTEECDARGKRIGGSQRPSNWENQL